jgi:hypothetical protein
MRGGGGRARRCGPEDVRDSLLGCARGDPGGGSVLPGATSAGDMWTTDTQVSGCKGQADMVSKVLISNHLEINLSCPALAAVSNTLRKELNSTCNTHVNTTHIPVYAKGCEIIR